MSPNDDPNSAAWWVAGIVGFGVAVWKLFFNLKRDSREDKEGLARQDLIHRLQEELRRKSEHIMLLDAAAAKLESALDEEMAKRRTAEDVAFQGKLRVATLERRLRELGEIP